jgi:hypothetical protein
MPTTSAAELERVSESVNGAAARPRGYGAFRLTRTLTRSTGAAWVAGPVFAFVPYRFQVLSHLHYLFAGWIPLLLEALVVFARAPTRRRATWLGLAFFMNALTCIIRGGRALLLLRVASRAQPTRGSDSHVPLPAQRRLRLPVLLRGLARERQRALRVLGRAAR